MAADLRLPRDLPRVRDPGRRGALRRDGGLDRHARVVRSAAIDVQLLHPDAKAPARTRPGDAAYDLRCLESFVLEPGERAIIPTGIAVAIHVGLCGLVLPRSGLAIEHGVTCLNAPGLIDASYRGEVRVIMINHGTQPFEADAGDRIAQLLIVPAMDDDPVVVDQLPPGGDDRGAGGFGSSGRR